MLRSDGYLLMRLKDLHLTAEIITSKITSQKAQSATIQLALSELLAMM